MPLSDGSNGAEPPDAACDPGVLGELGNCPSRTAVDLQGAVFVANRAFEHQGTVTKIAGFADDCVDRNGDGEIQTSHDVNGSGQIESYVDGEFLGQDDECLLWTVDAGGPGGVPRALAVAADGSVWVGLHGESRALQASETRATGDRQGERLRTLLVAAQIAMTLVLLIGAGLLVHSFVRLTSVSPGFQSSGGDGVVQTVRVELPEDLYDGPDRVHAFTRGVLERIQHMPGVESASVINSVPFAMMFQAP